MFGAVSREEYNRDYNIHIRHHNDDVGSIDRLNERLKRVEEASGDTLKQTVNAHSYDLSYLRAEIAALRSLAETQSRELKTVEGLPGRILEAEQKLQGFETIVEGLRMENASLKERLKASEDKIEKGEALLQKYMGAFDQLLAIQKKMAANAIVVEANTRAAFAQISDIPGRMDALQVALEVGQIVPRNPVQYADQPNPDIQQELVTLEENLNLQ